jgi:hypothetical protein
MNVSQTRVPMLRGRAVSVEEFVCIREIVAFVCCFGQALWGS